MKTLLLPLRTLLLAPFCLATAAETTPAAGIKAPILRLIDTSMDVIIAGGGSSADGEELEALQGGGHDPKRNGFTLQQAELSLAGVIDPYLRGESHIVFTEDGVELEEAFLVTQQPLAGWDLKAGFFLTEFGRANASHPHAWAWVDQPIIYTRFFGGDGLRNAGLRIGRLLPLPWFSELHLGAQNADGEFAASFLGGEIAHDHGAEDEHAHEEATEHAEEEEHADGHAEEEEHGHGADGIGGRAVVAREIEDAADLLYSIRWANAGELGDTTTLLFGLSGLTGPNASGEEASTWIAGADLTFKWTPVKNNRGFPFVKWESEFMVRDYEAAAFSPEEGHPEIAADTLRDHGFYSQIQYGFTPGWVCGIRGERTTGSGDSVDGRDEDPYRCDRTRLSPMLAYLPSEFTRVRVQYNYDDADFLDDEAHSVWISLEGMWGTHPAHKF